MSNKLLTMALAGALAAGSGGVALAQQANWQPSEQGARATEALNLLEFRGDGQYSNFQKSGQDFTADVVKNGQTMHVMINPDTRQIEPAITTG